MTVVDRTGSRFIWRALTGAVGALILAAARTLAVLAHGEVVESVPAPGAVLAAAPTEIVITLSDPVTAASTIEVLDTSFQPVQSSPLRADPATPGRLAVAVDPLPPGDYTVQWTAIDAMDGHKTQGSFVFTVEPGLAASAGAASDVVPTDGSGGFSAKLPGAVWWGWIVVIMGGAVSVWLTRRSRSKSETG